MNARVRQTTLHGAVATQQQRLPVVGKIRPGIKVPTAKAKAVPGVMDAYNAGIEAGASYDDITRAMTQIKGCPAYPLTPKNSPYFRVHQADCAPGQAEKIMELYATKRPGDKEPHLYSFPVVFPSDDIDLVFREQFEAWKASEIIHWSETDPATGKLNCMQRQQVKPDQNRRKRQWGGRPTEVVGPCDPNSCDLFGDGGCKHIGSLYFWVPGVTGAGVIELEFSSVYASMGVLEVLELVRSGIGRIKGTLGGKPIFTISKSQQDISVMDWQTGKAKRQGQQIIRLEASGLDMTAYLADQEMRMLEAPRAVPQLAAPQADDWVIDQVPDEEPDEEPVEISDYVEEVSEPEKPEPPPAAAEKPKPTTAVKQLRKQVADLLPVLKWSATDLEEMVVGNYGSTDAMHDETKLHEIVQSMINALPAASTNEAPY